MARTDARYTEGQTLQGTTIYVQGVPSPDEQAPEALEWGVSKETDAAWLRYWTVERLARMEVINSQVPEAAGVKLVWKRGPGDGHASGFKSAQVLMDAEGQPLRAITVSWEPTPSQSDPVTDPAQEQPVEETAPAEEVADEQPKTGRRSRKAE